MAQRPNLPWSSMPDPGDTAAAARLLQDFKERYNAPDGDLGHVLLSIGGNSPFLSELALREGVELRTIITHGPDQACDTALSELAAKSPSSTQIQVASATRIAKRRVALAAALADMTGHWTLEQVTGALTDLADIALSLSVAHLLHSAHDRGEIKLPHPSAPSRGSGFTVLAMGKMGARELNFSSDIDLILLYDPDAHSYNPDGIGAIFNRVARNLVSLMQQRDSDGYVFRTDLRLRPDPASTPLSVSIPAAITYYESQAQTWERAAMIKARPVAGDLALGKRFLESIRSFVWRRHLDFPAIADIKAMKLRMDDHKGTTLSGVGSAVSQLLKHDVKLGEGGIREVEFCAQTLQLVWGGRDPSLRSPSTIVALKALSAAGHLPQFELEQLVEAYRLLRSTEHRLQMVSDQQTHTLPSNEADFARFATFMGHSSGDELAEVLLAHSRRVRAIFAGLFTVPAKAADDEVGDEQQDLAARILWSGRSTAPPWEAWLAGRPRALRTERARALLLELLPSISSAMERQPNPVFAWTRLDEFIYRLPAGIQIFSLIRHNPGLLDRLGDVLGAAPSLADHLAAVPSAIEGLVSPRESLQQASQDLAIHLRDAAGLDEALGTASRLVRGEEFALAVAELDLQIDIDEAARARTALAEAVIEGLKPFVLKEHIRRFGRFPGGSLSIVALGKAGSCEMMAGSDLDLLFIYDHPRDRDFSAGARPVPAGQYFARAAQAIVAALTVPTRDGPLYQVDMRLRPSGNAGPVAVSQDAFRHYHERSAWTWERLALTRARVISGSAAMRRKTAGALRRALKSGDPGSILSDTAAMRGRLRKDLPPKSSWDVKLRDGGLIEVEFIAQALQLLHVQVPGLLQANTGAALKGLSAAGYLKEDDAVVLIAADRTWRTVQGLLRITVGRNVTDNPPEQVIGKLSERVQLPFASGPLQARLDILAEEVRAIFIRLIGDPLSP